MKVAKLLVMIFVLALTANAFAVYTPHIWHEDPTLYAGQTVYLKSAPSTPDNSPMHESWNLVDEFVDGNSNPYWLGAATTYAYKGYFYRILFYGGTPTLHIEPTAKVAFRDNIYAGSSSGSAGHGTVNVEGILIANRLRGWKVDTTMEVNVWGDGYLELNELYLGNNDWTGESTGWCNLMGGTIITNNMVFFLDGYVDITGGELLILNSNWDVNDVEAAIAAGDIFNSNADEGYALDVTTKDVDGTLYTSVTLKFDPLGRALYLLGEALGEKAHALDDLSNAIAMEAAARGFFQEVLSTLQPGTPDYLVVETAKAWTLVAQVGEQAAQRKINKTVRRLEDVLDLFGAEPPPLGEIPSLEDVEVEMADLNVDGVIDLRDLAALTEQWLGSYDLEW